MLKGTWRLVSSCALLRKVCVGFTCAGSRQKWPEWHANSA